MNKGIHYKPGVLTKFLFFNLLKLNSRISAEKQGNLLYHHTLISCINIPQCSYLVDYLEEQLFMHSLYIYFVFQMNREKGREAGRGMAGKMTDKEK